ncbi:hypothetical protein V2J09_000843 [Rumex salicifolius]
MTIYCLCYLMMRSLDSLCNADTRVDNDESIFTVDYLNTIRCSGVPNHVLKLKIGVPNMLLRNINQSLGYAIEQD